jgi:hypothetical protein
MRDDAQTAYLFQCGDEELFAISQDKTGKNIPRTSCTQGWLLREQFALGAQVTSAEHDQHDTDPQKHY